jgi:hypothetical protein
MASFIVAWFDVCGDSVCPVIIWLMTVVRRPFICSFMALCCRQMANVSARVGFCSLHNSFAKSVSLADVMIFSAISADSCIP